MIIPSKDNLDFFEDSHILSSSYILHWTDDTVSNVTAHSLAKWMTDSQLSIVCMLLFGRLIFLLLHSVLLIRIESDTDLANNALFIPVSAVNIV